MKENYLSVLEKNAKRCLKGKVKITVSLIVGLMINGVAFGVEEVSNENMYFSAGGCNIKLETSGAADFFYDTEGTNIKVDTSKDTDRVNIKLYKNDNYSLPIDVSVNNTSDIEKTVNGDYFSKLMGLNVKEARNNKIKVSSSSKKNTIKTLNIINEGGIHLTGENITGAKVIGINSNMLQRSQTSIINSEDGNININVALNSGIAKDDKSDGDSELYGIKNINKGRLSISSVENKGNITVTGIIEEQEQDQEPRYINSKSIESIGIKALAEGKESISSVSNAGSITSTASSNFGSAKAIGILAKSEGKENSQSIFNSKNSSIKVASTSQGEMAKAVGIKSIGYEKVIKNDGLIDVDVNEGLKTGGEFSEGVGILSNVVVPQCKSGNFDVKLAVASIAQDDTDEDKSDDEETLTQDILNTGNIDVTVAGNNTIAYGIKSTIGNKNIRSYSEISNEENSNSFINEGNIDVLATSNGGSGEAVGISNSGYMNSNNTFGNAGSINVTSEVLGGYAEGVGISNTAKLYEYMDSNNTFENTGSITVNSIINQGGESIAFGMRNTVDYMFYESMERSAAKVDPVSSEYKMTNSGDINVSSENVGGSGEAVGISNSSELYGYMDSNNTFENTGNINVSTKVGDGTATAAGMEDGKEYMAERIKPKI